MKNKQLKKALKSNTPINSLYALIPAGQQYVSGMGVHIPAVQSLLNLLFQVTIIDFSHPIKVRYIHADIVYNFAISRTLGKQYCSTAAESLCIKFMLGDQRQNMFKEGLLASVVRNRCFHCCYSFKCYYLCDISLTYSKMFLLKDYFICSLHYHHQNVL